ncbi:hypothetical protein [Micromonospora haikouensis]|uniref:SEL1-like repeat protein n=1 Tax=Micromonospora haikouensis TaxID=686309 RepID=UPI003D91F23B
MFARWSRWPVFVAAISVVLLAAGLFAWSLVADGKPRIVVVSSVLATLAMAAMTPLVSRIWRSDAGPRAVSVAGRPGFVTAPSGRRLPRVREAAALACGVHRAASVVDAGADGTPGPLLPEVPPYVPRDVDHRLDEALRAGGLVVVEGAPAAGKTRAAFEAMRRVMPGHQLLIPQDRDARALHALAERGRPLRRSVVWLDDLERYLGPEGISEQTLDVLRPPGRTDVVLLATLRPEALRAIRPATGSGGQELRGNRVEAVLRRAAVIRMPGRFSETERTRALAYRSDPRIAAAVAQEAAGEAGFAEHLAAAPAILARWLHGRDGAYPLAAALVTAAVDCRRIGYHRPVTGDLLAALTTHYPDRRPADDRDVPADQLRDALGWATEPVLGASGCLTVHHHSTYLAFDYLVDQVQRDIDALAPPAEIWDAVMPLLDDADPALATIAASAHRRGHVEIATRAWRRAAEAGNPMAMYYTAVLASNRGDRAEAGHWYERVEQTDSPIELRELGAAAWRAGDRQLATRWLTRAAEAGDREAMYNLVLRWREWPRRTMMASWSDRSDQKATYWLRRAAEAGHPAAMYRFGVYLDKTGSPEQAETWRARVEAVTEPAALAEIGHAAQEANDHDNAIRWLRRAAEHGNGEAMWHLGETYLDRHESRWREANDLDEAKRWFRAAANAGQWIAMFNLAWLQSKYGDLSEAEYWWKRCAQLGDHNAMRSLSILAADRGDLPAARQWLERSAGRGNRRAMIKLADQADERGDAAEAERWDRLLAGQRADDIDRASLRDIREAQRYRIGWSQLLNSRTERPEPLDAPVLRP